MFYKRNLPVITNSFGTNDNVFINLDGINPSLKMIIPLFHENEQVNRIGDISLYYSNEYDFDNSPFWRNIMISHIKVLSSIVKTNVNTIEYATITFEDGKEVVFERDLTYASYENQTKDILINDDTDYYIVVEYDVYDNPKSITSLELFDKNGNYYHYDYVENASLWPKYYRRNDFTDTDNIQIIRNGGEYIIYSYKNQNIYVTMSQDNKVYDIVYTIDDFPYISCILSYRGDDLYKVEKHVYKNNDYYATNANKIESKRYIFNNQYIEVLNEITNLCSRYYINNTKVTSFVNYVNNNESQGQETTVDYYYHRTVVTDYKGRSLTYCIYNERAYLVINHNYEVSTITYDDNGRILEEIDFINIYKDESIKRGNLLPSGYTFESYNVRNKDSQSIVRKVNDHLEIYNNANDVMYIDFIVDNITLNINDGLTFISSTKKVEEVNKLLYYDITLTNTNNNKTKKVTIISNDITGVVTTVSKQMIVDNTYNQIKITIIVPPKGRFEVSNIQVYNYLLGNIYEYNSRKLL